MKRSPKVVPRPEGIPSGNLISGRLHLDALTQALVFECTIEEGGMGVPAVFLRLTPGGRFHSVAQLR